MGQILRLKKGSKLTFQELDNNFEFPNVWDSDSIYATGMRVFDGTLLDYLCIQDVTSPSTIPLTNTAYWKKIGDSTNAVWGDITGTLSDQLDLQAALDDKIPFTSQNYVSVNANGSGTVNGTALRNAVIAAQALTPNGSALGFTNRAVVLLLPGVYDLGSNNISLDQFVDIIGLGDPEEIIITSINSTGTIQIADTNDYVLRNLSIFNTGSGGSITHNANQFDYGIWDNLILQGKNTNYTTFLGTYNKLNCFSDNILNGNIGVTAIITDCRFGNNSCGYNNGGGNLLLDANAIIKNCIAGSGCFGFSNTGSVIIGSDIIDCIGRDFCFGFSNVGSITLNSNGHINGCKANSFSFITSGTQNVTINGKILNCISTDDNSFGYASSSSTLGSNALIVNCIGGSNSFLSTNSGSVNINGKILNCIGAISSFGYSFLSDVNISSTGKIINCQGISNCFGSSNNAPVIVDGIIDGCYATSNSFLYSSTLFTNLSSTGIIRNCKGTDNCFMFANTTITLDGIIENCIGNDHCFAYSTTNNISITGIIQYCKAVNVSFGSSPIGNVSISGIINNCYGTVQCFGYTSSGTTTISGQIINCMGSTSCFGTTTSTGQIINCTRTGGYGVHAGSIERCKFSENSGSVPTITVTTGCRLKYNTIFQAGASDVVFATVAATPIVSCFNNMNKARNANAVNSIATPYDVIDSNITL